jgi:methylenetetrahydrofolate--tRNA-(uracil-5-)-methyltransferase
MVCSNSFRSDNPHNAVGLLKREMEALGSLVMARARESAVPAGDALAVDRDAFARSVTAAIESEPNIEIVREECPELPPRGIVVLATGPLTSARLSESIRTLLGEGELYFYDSMAPIVTADSLDFAKIYRASRYGKGEGEDYLNCPLDRAQYEEFISDLLAGETVPIHDFEKGIYFEGCLPIEVMAERGAETLRHGPLKPMGLEDPRTGRRPYAVVQLRQDDLASEHYNLVGFQTKLRVGEQKRIFRKIPGLENANFVRFGMLHRNTYIHSPAHLDRFFRMQANPRVFFAGQITGVEGYLESAATGLYVGRTAAQLLEGADPVPAPFDTALGSLSRHCSQRPRTKTFEPMNVTFGMIEDSSQPAVRDRAERRRIVCDRALESIGRYEEQTRGPRPATALAG